MFRLSSIGYEPTLYFLMCHDNINIHQSVNSYLIIFFLIYAITTLSSFLSILTNSLGVNNMPVTTRSMARGGLQDDASSVPLPLHPPTCTNAIDTTPDCVDLRNSSMHLVSLPELPNQSSLTSSSTEHNCTSASISRLDFEISEFETLKLTHPESLPVVSILNSSQFFLMESDCKDDVISSVPSSSPSSNDEILKVLTAISSQMVVGQHDLQQQLVSSNLYLKTELEKVREEDGIHDYRKYPSIYCTPIASSVSNSSPLTPPLSSMGFPLSLHHLVIFKVKCSQS